MKILKVRDLAFGFNELVNYPQHAHAEPNENGRMIFHITHLGGDNFELKLHADRIVVNGDHELYVW